MSNFFLTSVSAQTVSQHLVAAEVYDRLQQAMASDPNGFCELYRDYLSDALQTLAELRAACAARSANDLSAKAHYLKSSSLVLGVRSVAQYCADVDDFARATNFRAASQRVRQMGELIREVQRELEQRLGPQVVPAAA